MSRAAALRAAALAAALLLSLAPELHAQDDPLPAGALARLGSNRLHHPVGVSGLAIPSGGPFNGKAIFSRGIDGEVRVWDLHTGRLLRTLEAGHVAGRGLSCPRDGSLLGLSAEEGDAVLLDARTGERQALPPDLGRNIALSPDGHWIALWGPPVSRMSILSVADGTVKISLEETLDSLMGVAFNGDGSRVAILGWVSGGGHDHSARVSIRDLPSGDRVAEFDTDHLLRFRPLFSRDDARLFIAGSDVFACNARTGAEEARWHPDGGPPTGRACNVLALSPDGARLAVLEQSSLAVLDSRTGAPQLRIGNGELCPLNDVAFAPSGKLFAAAGADHAVHVWDSETGQPLLQQPGHQTGIVAVAAGPAAVLTLGNDGRVGCWATDSGALLWMASAPDVPGKALALSADMSLAASSSGLAGHIVLRDAASGQSRDAWSGTGDSAALCLAFAPDGRTLAAGFGDGFARLWAVSPESRDEQLSTEPPDHLAFDVRPAQRELDGGGIVSAIGWSRTGDVLATAASNIRLWSAETGERLREIRGTSPIADIEFSPDGKLLATANADRTVRLYDAETGEQRAVISSHTGRVNALAFAPDGQWLASASGNETSVRFWDVATGALIAQLAGHETEVLSLAFVPDGHALVSAGADAAALVWAMPPVPAMAPSH